MLQFATYISRVVGAKHARRGGDANSKLRKKIKSQNLGANCQTNLPIVSRSVQNGLSKLRTAQTESAGLVRFQKVLV